MMNAATGVLPLRAAGHTAQAMLFVWALLLTLASAWPAPARGATEPAEAAAVTIRNAQFTGQAVARAVTLPHGLDTADFRPEGSTAHYQLSLDLPTLPERPLGIYIRKMSLSGRISVNDREIGACGQAPLAHLRCQYMPQLFVPPIDVWRTGTNDIRIEIYANSRQTNGLSDVRVGDAGQLASGPYLRQHLLQIDLVWALTWVSVALGLFSLAIALALRDDAIYLWFGLGSLLNAASNLNVLIVQPLIDRDLYNWLMLCSRIVSVPLLFLTMRSFFAGQFIGLRRALLVYLVCALTVVWLSGNDRMVLAGLYLPLVALGVVFLPVMIFWSWRSRAPAQIVVTLLYACYLSTGMLDWWRLSGRAGLDGIYLLGYAHTGMLVLVGAMMVKLLVDSLKTARELGARLEQKIEERTRDLESAWRTIVDMEQRALRLTESIPVGTYVYETAARGITRRFTFVSERFLRMMDLTREAVMSDPDLGFQAVHPDDRDAFAALIAESTANERGFNWIGRFNVQDRVRWFSVESVPRKLSGNALAWEGVVIDITDFKATEQALRDAHEQLLSVEVARSRGEAREQLLQDMHDGFGARLLEARQRARQDQGTEFIARVLSECIADLDLLAETFGRDDEPLADAIRSTCLREQRRLHGQAIQLSWTLRIDQIPQPPHREALQILRMLHRAIGSAIARGSPSIAVEADRDPDPHRLVIRISDSAASPPDTDDLLALRERAQAIGASLEADSTADGHRITLRLALPVTAPGIEGISA